MIKFNFDASGVQRAVRSLCNELRDREVMGAVLHKAASAIWVPLIRNRLETTETAQSNWRDDVDLTMMDTDPDFVKSLGEPYGWAQRTEGERRDYEPGRVRQISDAITASTPMEGPGYLFVGIGDMDLLDQVADITTRDQSIKLWQLLQWGTGIYGKEQRPILRRGLQIFMNRNTNPFEGVLIGAPGASKMYTLNPGFKGREYFLQWDGDIHQMDFVTVRAVKNWIKSKVKQYSYK